jgi:hypothetical protein
MSILNKVYGKGKDYVYDTLWEDDLGFQCSVRYRMRPKEEQAKPFIEVCRKHEDWAGVVWRTPNNRKVSVVTLEDEPKLWFSYCGYELQPELIEWIKMNKDVLLRFWHQEFESEEEIEQLGRDLNNLKPYVAG